MLKVIQIMIKTLKNSKLWWYIPFVFPFILDALTTWIVEPNENETEETRRYILVVLILIENAIVFALLCCLIKVIFIPELKIF